MLIMIYRFECQFSVSEGLESVKPNVMQEITKLYLAEPSAHLQCRRKYAGLLSNYF